ncbi:amidohydrolase family protein [Paenibacillus sp. GCM10027626]|uniref:amidohydrolase family protein n=1 Tax=Paenibacillus sp. GCM10027626 TaxID=3273411 RepID=UPI003636EB55
MDSNNEHGQQSGRRSMRAIAVIAVFLVVVVGGYFGYTLFNDKNAKDGGKPNISEQNNNKQAEGTEPGGKSEPEVVKTAAELLEETVTQADLDREYDVVISGGRVVNPETQLDQEGLNVGILGDKIGVVTAKPLKGKREIDAKGLVVSPGFIDNLSYDPNPLGVWQKIGDGVTSNIAMHGGTSNPKQWYDHYERDMPPVSFGASFFYTQARNQFKLGRYDGAKPEQTAKLLKDAEDALKNGALGISFSLEYVPGITPEEIIPLMELANEYNVPVYFHGRYSDAPNELEGTRELIDYAEKTGAAVHIDHINSTGGTFSMKEALALIEEARAKGYDITACTYPYDYWGTYLNSARFDTGWQERFRITYHDLQIAGTTERLDENSFIKYKKEGKLAVAYAIPPEAVIDAFKAPYVMIGSDAILEPGFNNHPRASGTFARAIGLYVREQQVMSLMDGIAKLSLMPAQRLEKQAPELRKKGRLAKGMDADIVIFDFNTIRDRSTVEKPDLMSEGIRYVLVAGKVALDDGELNKKVRPGQALRSHFERVAAGTAAGSLQWGGKAYPLIAYNQATYVDLAALGEQGYSIVWDQVSKQYTIEQGTAAGNTEKAAPAEKPKEGQLMLERGYKAKAGDKETELLSIGKRAFVPVSFLKSLGIKAEHQGDVWTVEP